MNNRDLYVKNEKNELLTKIRIESVENKINYVLKSTVMINRNRKDFVDSKKLQILKKYLNIPDFLQGNSEKIYIQCDEEQSKQYEQMLQECQRQSQKIEEDYNQVKQILKDFNQNGLSQFYVLQQIQQLDFVDIKKTVLQVKNLYEDGILNLEKLNQIYLSFYNLSLQKCGICLIQPEINQVIIIECGHNICRECQKTMISGERKLSQLNRCPFCRKQIEFLVKNEK